MFLLSFSFLLLVTILGPGLFTIAMAIRIVDEACAFFGGWFAKSGMSQDLCPIHCDVLDFIFVLRTVVDCSYMILCGIASTPA
jgi:hypothetical protein